MQTQMTSPENDAIRAVQAALAAAKQGLRNAINSCTDLMAIEQAAGRTDAYNAAFRARGAFRRDLGQIEIDHADASMAMDTLFANSGPIIFGGGGGR